MGLFSRPASTGVERAAKWLQERRDAEQRRVSGKARLDNPSRQQRRSAHLAGNRIERIVRMRIAAGFLLKRP